MPRPPGRERKIGTASAIRAPLARRLARLGPVEILAGIPAFNNERTLAGVLAAVEEGLARHFPGRPAAVLVADGGSTDDTREVAARAPARAARLVGIYRGLPGKGSAVRAILEAAAVLRVRACLLLDADLRSLTPEWVRALAAPVLASRCDFVAPWYRRFKFDGTITNHVAYPLTRALYGRRLRQPIGGDFALAGSFLRRLLAQDVWRTDVARFGIDIWLTTNALAGGARLAQARLGAKIHDPRDPAESLGPMFRQVAATLFALMERHEAAWRPVRGSRPVPFAGRPLAAEPPAFAIDAPRLVEDFAAGFARWGGLWRRLLAPRSWRAVCRLRGRPPGRFLLPAGDWVDILYDLVAAFHHLPDSRRGELVEAMIPLYFARIASFANQARDLDGRSAEVLVEEQALRFERRKDYLCRRWSEGLPGQ